ncbi:MAG: PLP-dependent aminotransferase family protein [Chloroflexota bacterium]|nr:MAG: PLP-dependent aminotransferase family protein [Chloroflexota bacterium]
MMDKIPLYEQLASEISHQIEQGTFRAGERIPSVRRSSQLKNLSITTVLQAYQLLEDRGIIEARPQSGYYVRTRRLAAIPEPEVSAPPLDPNTVTIDNLAMMVLRDTVEPNLVQFGAAIPDPDLLPTAKLNRILAAITRIPDRRQYTCGTPEGCDELRIQVAQRALTAGCTLAPSEIVITLGCTEAISLALRAVCKPGDLVAVESPTYFGILQALESLGLRALEIPTHHREGISLSALRFALDHHPVRACLIVTNFNNPLGSCMPDDNKKELVKMLAAREIPLIEDDIFGEMYYEGDRPKVAKAYDRKDLVLLCSSFTKDISPSFRVGWLAPSRFQIKIERLKMASNIATPIFTQLAIAQFLETGGYDHHLRRIRRAYELKISAMSQAIIRYFPEGTRVTSPQGGFVLWVQLPEEVDSLALYRLALKSKITLAPGYIFSATHKYKNFIRLNAAYWSEQNSGAVQRLGELVSMLAKH